MSKQDFCNMNDESLMEQYRLGNSAAFEELYRRHSGKVYAYLRKRLPGTAVNDLFQDVFLKLHKGRFLYNTSLPFLPWLFTITRHTYIDAIRKPGLREDEAFSCDAVTSELAHLAPQTAFAQDLSGYDSLNPREKEVLSLHFGEDLRFEEIAKRLNLQASAVRKISSRAIQRLRKLFEVRS